MVDYYVKFLHIANKATAELVQEEQGPYNQVDFLKIIGGLQPKIKSGEVKIRARTHWNSHPINDQEWLIDAQYVDDIADVLKDYVPPPTLDSPDQPNLKQVAVNAMKALEIKWNAEEANDENPIPLEEWERELLAYQQNGEPADQDVYPDVEEEEEEEDGDGPVIRKLRNDGSSKWLIDKPRMRQEILDLVRLRIEDMFSLVEGPNPVQEDEEEYPQYNNDGLELAILDGYVTFDELVTEFRNKLKRYLEVAATKTNRSYQDALSAKNVDLDKARPNPTFLENFDMRMDSIPPADENDQSWVPNVPSHLRDKVN